jgi:hypothetical protein
MYVFTWIVGDMAQAISCTYTIAKMVQQHLLPRMQLTLRKPLFFSQKYLSNF